MYAMAYITRIKKTFLPDARRSSNFIKRMEKLTNTKGKYLSDAKKKVLTLNVSKQWFNMIVADEKTEEYREIKPYWASRLVNQQAESGEVLFDEFGGYCRVIGKLEYKPFTHVLFINGYRKDSPRIEKEIESITIGNPKKGLCPDKWLDKEFFVIKFKQRMNKEEKCFGNCHWFDNEDIYGVGWCTINSCEVSCDFVCIRHIN